MLEDALNRDVPGSSKDVGWRRWGAKEQKEREMESRRSMDSSHSFDVSTPSPGQSPVPGSAAPNEGRFFKFRFGAVPGSATSSGFTSPRLPTSPRMGQMQSASAGGQFHSSHLTSASLPSLIPERDKEIENLTAELDKEKKAHAAAVTAKDALEAELESLSQALFEEVSKVHFVVFVGLLTFVQANKMVATERMKLADTEEELREAQAEKEALRSALKLLEQQRRPSFHLQNGGPRPISLPSPPSKPMHGRSMSMISTFSASSAIAIKSPVSSSAPSSPISARRLLPDPPTSANTIIPTPVSADHVDPEEFERPDTALSSKSVSPLESTQGTPLDVSEEAKENKAPLTVGSKMSSTSSLDVVASSSASSVSSSMPSPSPSGFAYVAPRPVVFYDGDTESPWADVRSATASPAGMF